MGSRAGIASLGNAWSGAYEALDAIERDDTSAIIDKLRSCCFHGCWRSP